jgi:WD40 repeat protein
VHCVSSHRLPICILLAAALGAILTKRPLGAVEPFRIVPQLGWPAEGRFAPNGGLYAGVGSDSVRLVDAQHVALAWTIPLQQPHDVAFSRDGHRLAACGAERGFLLDLRSCELRYLPEFRGLLVAFLSGSEKLLVVRAAAKRPHPLEAPDDNELFVYDLAGRQQARYPVAMSVPRVLTVSPGDQTVRIAGLYGNPQMHVPRMGPCEQTVSLVTGRSAERRGPVEGGWPKPQDDHTLVKLPSVPPDKMLNQRAGELYWSETSGRCVVYGSGLTNAWDVRAGRFLASLGKQDQVSGISGFLSSDTILANAWKDGQCRLSMVDVRTGQVVLTRLEPAVSLPAPDGRHFTARTGWYSGQKEWLELYSVPLGQPLFRKPFDRAVMGPSGWSHTGRYFVWSRARGPEAAVLLVHATDGKVETIKLGDLFPRHTENDGWRLQVWSHDLDDGTGRMAVGTGRDPHTGSVAIVRLADKKTETLLERFPSWVTAVRLMTGNCLLTATGDGLVQLWDLRRRKPLWSTPTQEQVVQFGFLPGSPLVVCVNMFRSASVLRLEDGALLRRTDRILGSDSTIQLISGGKLALEMAHESLEVRLTEAVSGTPLLGYCPLPDGQWLVHSPQGDWDGSERVHDWVRFYRGLSLLSPAEAEQHRNPAAIRAVLKQAFSP